MGTKMFKLVTFQKCLQKPLSQLNSSKYGATHQKRGIARAQLLVVQHELHEDPLNVRDQYISTLFASLKLIYQKSKMDWKICFFAMVKQRKHASFIFQLRNEHGIMVEEKQQRYYFELLRKLMIFHQCECEVFQPGHILTVEQHLKLCKPFTDVEVKYSFLSHPMNPLVLIGSIVDSIKQIRMLLCDAILEFLDFEELLHQLNHTNGVLLPKVQNSKNANDFRPISCCNVAYKCITKLI
ncbi:LOW QUALITY PROTEIN: hypothetical protein Cgig2_032887 [Carnegiea gigantea]|uniref:Uncharacterized protein n=1 Tax=Carnegiea gigantea TaxID=171969 RepID=A0A9Q1JXA5_9CARY|nr:LOW QUALITY PROTEIN: hypothetical protein Cgig2_032887 [Carnegiea gigantea]